MPTAFETAVVRYQSPDAETVVDLDAEQTTCPACQTQFTPDGDRCPECGART